MGNSKSKATQDAKGSDVPTGICSAYKLRYSCQVPYATRFFDAGNIYGANIDEDNANDIAVADNADNNYSIKPGMSLCELITL